MIKPGHSSGLQICLFTYIAPAIGAQTMQRTQPNKGTSGRKLVIAEAELTNTQEFTQLSSVQWKFKPDALSNYFSNQACPFLSTNLLSAQHV